MKKAYIQVISAASLWGIMGVFVRALLALGYSQIQISLLRCLVAAVVMVPILCFKDKRLFIVRKQDLWCFIGTGIVGLAFMNLCYFTSLQYNTLSVAATLLHTSPAFVLLLSAILFKEKMKGSSVAALALVFGGCVMVTGALGTGADSITLSGLLYGLGSGLCYALYCVFNRYALNRGYHTMTIMFYTFLFCVAGNLPFSEFHTLAAKMTLGGCVYAAGIGIICSVIPSMLYIKGMSRLDNSTTAMLAAIEPVAATVMSVLVFGEALHWQNLLGIIMLFSGIFVMAKCQSKTEKAL